MKIKGTLTGIAVEEDSLAAVHHNLAEEARSLVVDTPVEEADHSSVEEGSRHDAGHLDMTRLGKTT